MSGVVELLKAYGRSFVIDGVWFLGCRLGMAIESCDMGGVLVGCKVVVVSLHRCSWIEVFLAVVTGPEIQAFWVS